MSRYWTVFGDPTDPETKIIEGHDPSMHSIDKYGTRRLTISASESETSEEALDVTVGADHLLGYKLLDDD